MPKRKKNDFFIYSSDISLWNALPLNKGQTFFQTDKHPDRWYWPRANSKKNKGRPPKINITKYGMRKAPENKVILYIN